MRYVAAPAALAVGRRTADMRRARRRPDPSLPQEGFARYAELYDHSEAVQGDKPPVGRL